MSQDNFLKSGRYMYFLAWFAFFFLLTSLFYFKTNPSVQKAKISGHSIELTADAQGHFQIKGQINGYPAEFLLDTGATLVAVPKSLAEKIGLKSGYPITIDTASGTVEGFLTRLDKLSFGEFTLNNVKAVIIPSESQVVLMGMNVLKNFSINQRQGKMSIKPGDL